MLEPVSKSGLRRQVKIVRKQRRGSPLESQPSMGDLEELKLMIASRLDVDEFLDILGFNMYDLVEALEDEVKENYQELLRACD